MLSLSGPQMKNAVPACCRALKASLQKWPKPPANELSCGRRSRQLGTRRLRALVDDICDERHAGGVIVWMVEVERKIGEGGKCVAFGEKQSCGQLRTMPATGATFAMVC